MKVKCIKIYNESTKEYQEQSAWLTIGKEYIVLSIDIYFNKVVYLIVDDSPDKSPGLHRADQFEIVSHVIPRNWKILVGNIALFIMGPEAWNLIGFWENCHDGDEKALEIYKREAKIIYEEEGVRY